DGHAVGVTHSDSLNAGTERIPIKGKALILLQESLTTCVRKALDRVDGQDALIPEATFEGGVRSALFCEVGGGLDCKIAYLLHRSIGKLDGGGGFVGQTQGVQGILKAHNAEPYGTVSKVRVTGGGHAVVVIIDDIIEHAHG